MAKAKQSHVHVGVVTRKGKVVLIVGEHRVAVSPEKSAQLARALTVASASLGPSKDGKS